MVQLHIIVIWMCSRETTASGKVVWFKSSSSCSVTVDKCLLKETIKKKLSMNQAMFFVMLQATWPYMFSIRNFVNMLIIFIQWQLPTVNDISLPLTEMYNIIYISTMDCILISINRYKAQVNTRWPACSCPNEQV